MLKIFGTSQSCDLPKDVTQIVDVFCGANTTYAVTLPGYTLQQSTTNTPGTKTALTFHPVVKFQNLQARSVKAEANNVCVLDYSGHVVVCGTIPLPGVSSVPRSISLPHLCTSVSCGSLFSMMLLENGDLYSLGMNSYGALGLSLDDEKFMTNEPRRVMLRNVVEVSCGGCHTLARLHNGSVLAWGRNDQGQLGSGDTTNRNTPYPVASPVGEGVEEGRGEVLFQMIACGDYHTLALGEDGTAYACGSGRHGQLGIEPPPQYLHTLQAVPNLPPARFVAAGGGYNNSHSCAIAKVGGALYVWGSNSQGQLGLPPATHCNVFFPTQVPSIRCSLSTHVSCGWLHTAIYDKYSGGVAKVDPRWIPGLGTLQLPYDALARIWGYLASEHPRELCRLSSLSSALLETTSFDCLWEGIFAQRFPNLYRSKYQGTEPVKGWRALVTYESRIFVPTKSVTGLLGFVKRLFQKRQYRLLMLGLDAAGKTSLLYKLKLGEIVTTIPTIGFNVEEVDFKGTKFTCWDVGGPDKIRALWRHYYQDTHAIVFVVDSNDTWRIDEVKTEIQRVNQELETEQVIFLIFANKQDLPGALSASQVTEKLCLNQLRNRLWKVFPCVATTGEGVYEGLDWLNQYVGNA
eukprot:PhF_6_TR21000/c0_g1_i1/m.30151/K07937/ARF1; ADP-ribosylation factor 1